MQLGIRGSGRQCARAMSTAASCRPPLAFQTKAKGWGLIAGYQMTRNSSNSPTVQASLGQILAEELVAEEGMYDKSETLQEPPADFTVTEMPGDCQLELTKQHGEEKISIIFSVTDFQDDEISDFIDEDDEDYDEDGSRDALDKDLNLEEGEEEYDDYESEESVASLTFNVHVSKGEKTLTFECSTDGFSFEVENITLLSNGAPLDVVEYEGPNFADLEDVVQDAFIDYLCERGIDFDLVHYVYQLAVDKEQREYMSWLQNVKDFVKT